MFVVPDTRLVLICSGWALPAAALWYFLVNFALKLFPAYRTTLRARYYWPGLLVSWLIMTAYRCYNHLNGAVSPDTSEIFVAPFVVSLIVVFCMYNIQAEFSEGQDKTNRQ